jgi:hypothetical protein
MTCCRAHVIPRPVRRHITIANNVPKYTELQKVEGAWLGGTGSPCLHCPFCSGGAMPAGPAAREGGRGAVQRVKT